MRRDLSRFALASAALTTLAGCADSTDLLRPDWERVLRREAERAEDWSPTIDPTPAFANDIPAPSPDSGVVEISLEQASMLALGRNRDLDVQRLTPEITGAFEMIARGEFDPELFASVEFGQEESVETARATGGQFAVTGSEAAVEAGVRQSLPTGTDIEAVVTEQRNASDRTPEQQSARVGLTVTQALLRGAGPVANLVNVRQAELDTAASRFELRGYIEALLAETEVAYWRCVLAEEEIAIFERSLQVARDQSDEIAQRIEVGVLPRTESAAARAEVALREQALIDARAELRDARLELRRLLDLPPRTADDPIRTTSEPSFEPVELDAVSDLAAAAIINRPDLNEARLRLEQGRLETVRTRNGLLPRLDFFITLGASGYADTFEQSFRNIDEGAYDWNAGLTLSQSLERLEARGEHRAAMASRAQAAAAVRALEQLIVFDVHRAASELDRARDQIDATRRTRRLQEETAAAEVERFNAGASTAILVAQAQRDLLATQIAEVEAVVAYRIALIELHRAEGTLLERRGVIING